MNTPQHQYKIIKELGHNRTGGRLVYLATDTTTNQPVVIKQFQFAKSNANEPGLKLHELEAQILKNLNHPGIPRYLNSFETSKGFYLFQEYKEALPLTQSRNYPLENIQKITISILDILIYLQSQNLPIIHRDIKPENILVDEQLNVYLIDFGLAKMGGHERTANSPAGGTFGFMAPEQIYNRPLTNATDLYSLGATLICLLTGTKSTEVGQLIDEEGKFNFKHLVPQINSSFIGWLGKMVQPNPKDRYPSAATAKAILLQPIVIKKAPPRIQNKAPALKIKRKISFWNFLKSLIMPDLERSQLFNLTEEQITLALTRKGNPTWTEADFEKLLYTLGCAGYGRLESEQVRKELLKMQKKRLSETYPSQTKSNSQKL